LSVDKEIKKDYTLHFYQAFYTLKQKNFAGFFCIFKKAANRMMEK
jgi:hypothetical protein